ncbi:MAG: hypothetical protein LBI42_00775 [Chitinispirillales bacterium]|jgi:hypothetical protein|nr:hypothetical protein [Chitinispirillales bacterium]
MTIDIGSDEEIEAKSNGCKDEYEIRREVAQIINNWLFKNSKKYGYRFLIRIQCELESRIY